MINFTDKIADIIVGKVTSKKPNDKVEPKTKEEKKKLKEELLAEKQKKNEEDKKIGKFIFEWRRLMAHLGLENNLDQTYHMSDIELKNYGFKTKIHPYVGGTLASLEEDKIKNAIQDHFKCIFATKRESQTGYIEAQFIQNQIPDIKFVPVKLKPWILYLGTGIDGEMVTVDMLTYPHVLDQGCTNAGKSRLIDCIMTNLIATESPEDVCFWILQCDKDDQAVYQQCKHVKGYAETLEEMDAMLNYLVEVVEYRKKIIKPLRQQGKASNIYTYNQICKGLNLSRFNYQYIIIDEYPNIMPESSDDKSSKEIKTAIQGKIDRLIRIGRYVGMYFVLGIQRSTIDKMPSFIRAMANTVVTFRVNNMSSSIHAIDTDEAMFLKQREAIFKTNEKVRLRTVTIDDPTIFNYINPYKCSNGEYRNFNFSTWMSKKEKSEKTEKKSIRKQEKTNDVTNSVPLRIPSGATYVGEQKEEKKKKIEDIKKIEEKQVESEPVKQIDAVTNLVETKPKSPFIVHKSKPKSPFLMDNWTDPYKNCNVIDKTTIKNSECEYKPKGEISNDIKG